MFLIISSAREKLDKIKSTKAELEQARIDLEAAQRKGDFTRASELRYGVIPTLEAKLPKEETVPMEAIEGALTDTESPEQPMRPLGTQEEVESLIHERVTADDISRVVARMTGIPVQVRISFYLNGHLLDVTDKGTNYAPCVFFFWYLCRIC